MARKAVMSGLGKPGLGRAHIVPPGHTKFGPVKKSPAKSDVELAPMIPTGLAKAKAGMC